MTLPAVWPLLPNWRDVVQVTLAYNTEIISSRNGTEQRRALRQTPRRSLSFSLTATTARFRAATRAISGLQGQLIGLPEPVSFVKTAEPWPAGSQVAEIENEAPWLFLGAVVAIADKTRCDVVEVDYVALVGGSYFLHLVNATTHAWDEGTRVFRLRMGRLGPNLDLPEKRLGVIDGTISFDVDPGSDVEPDPPAATDLFNGREVFTQKNNWASDRALNFTRDLQLVDYSRGRVRSFNPVPFSPMTRGYTYLAKSADEIALYVDFFRRAYGRRGEFYVPSDSPDLVLSDAQIPSSYLVQLGPDVFNAYARDPSYRAISIKFFDGTRAYRVIQRIELLDGNSRITFTEPLPALSPATVDVISLMPILRNATDNLIIQYQTAEVATLTFSYVSIAYPDTETTT